MKDKVKWKSIDQVIESLMKIEGFKEHYDKARIELNSMSKSQRKRMYERMFISVRDL